MKKLLRVRTKTYNNQGSYKEDHGGVTHYTGYDRDEAIRLYFQHEADDKWGQPGDYGTETIFEVVDAATLSDNDIMRTTMREESIPSQ